MRREGLSMKNSIGTLGDRTRDLQARNAEPQPTAPPRVPGLDIHIVNLVVSIAVV